MSRHENVELVTTRLWKVHHQWEKGDVPTE